MALSLGRWRRAATQFAIRQTIGAMGMLPAGARRVAVRSLVSLAASVPMLRRRIRENVRLALGQEPSAETIRLYFQQVGWFMSNTLTTFHQGFARSAASSEIEFDQSVRVLDEAAAEGRGVVLACPHWAGHELAAAAINLRHPLVMLVREAATSERAERKLKWYRSLGAEIVLRPHGASTMSDALAYLQVLKRGKVLAVTPDLLSDADEGVEVSIFGRLAQLHRGAFVLAVLARAPMIRASGEWKSAKLVLTFERAPAPMAGERKAAIRETAQDWCRWFEERVRAHPELWLFWLDKRWSRFLRATPRSRGVE
jgi:Kdo2-lipid IVA lauroyltransferase/acyltransferase